MNEIKFYRMNFEEPDKKEFTFDGISYFSITLDGYLLTYAKSDHSPNSLRLFILCEELAKYLGFSNLRWMMANVKIQYWRGKISVKAIKRHFR